MLPLEPLEIAAEVVDPLGDVVDALAQLRPLRVEDGEFALRLVGGTLGLARGLLGRLAGAALGEVVGCRRLRDAGNYTPVVMLTSSQEESDVLKSYELGVNAYVVKPVEFKQFVAAIADLGVFWAVLNEPPPGSLRATRRYE